MTTDADLMARWPEVLIDQVARKNFFLVIGAGVSRSACDVNGLSPPGWRPLIEALIDSYVPIGEKRFAKRLATGDKLLEAAEFVRISAEKQGKGQDFLQAIVRQVEGAGNAPFMPSALHNAILDLSPTIIVTTNYDRVLERAGSTGFSYLTAKSTEIGRSVRTGSPVVIKLHGDVTEPPSMILARTDYTWLQREGTHALDVVRALFETRTALFLGYSLSDPDMQLLLENVLGACGGPPSHYMLCPKVKEHQSKILGYCYGVAPISYKDVDEVEPMVRLLAVAATARLA